MKNKHIGSSFDNFLKEEGILEEVEAKAIKRVMAFKIEEMMKEMDLTKCALAKRMHTSRTALDRLLDPNNTSITLHTIEKAAVALGTKMEIQFVNRYSPQRPKKDSNKNLIEKHV